MNLAEKHFRKTEELVRAVSSDKIAEWLLNDGYYPEQYVFPPNFKTSNFKLLSNPYSIARTRLKNKKGEFIKKPDSKEILNIAYPKNELTDRIFGIYHPQHYHDLVWYIHKNWRQIQNHIFPKHIKIFSYSFPIPISENSVGTIGNLRSGRMIYENLELAEKDLLAESYKYKYLLKTDVKNFYPSIYTHTISWAIHTKKTIRQKNKYSNENNFLFCGNVLDRLMQYANDRKTNGIPIGPAISDLIAEIILTAVDKMVSKELRNKNFLAARYKDDYFFLIQSEDQAHNILKIIQMAFKEFNLTINEEKTKKCPLPDSLLRPWIHEFNKLWNSINPEESKKISFKDFLMMTQEILKIDNLYPNTGTINKFLSKLTFKDNYYALHIDYENIKNKNQAILRTFSLLMHLSKRSKNSFPSVLGIVESIIRAPDREISKDIKDALISELKVFSKGLINSEDEHKKLWWIYLILSNSVLKSEIDIKGFYESKTLYLESYKKNSQKFYSDFKHCSLFDKVEEKTEYPISKHLDVFNRD